MDFIDTEGYRANVGIILIDADCRVLIAGRRGRTGWQFPQGGIHAEEAAEEAMYRELREEVGLTPDDVELVGTTQDWLRYRLPEKYVRHERKPLCIGQKQRWFLLQLVADTERLCFDLTDQPEFDHGRLGRRVFNNQYLHDLTFAFIYARRADSPPPGGSRPGEAPDRPHLLRWPRGASQR